MFATIPSVISHVRGGKLRALAVTRTAEMRDKFIQQGADPVGSTAEEFGAYMRSETEKWAKLVKATGARVD